MARYEHLPLRRLEGELQRRKAGGGKPPDRNPKTHGAEIESEIATVLQAHRNRPKIGKVDPSLILKVRTSGPVDEADWARADLAVVATDPEKSVVLFADDAELQEFRRRVTAYQRDPPEGQKGPEFASFVGAIDEVGELTPNDKLGAALVAAGVDDVALFNPDERYVLDLELWQPGAEQIELFTHRVAQRLEELDGKLISQYRGNAALLMRIEGSGACIRELLELPEIALVDLPPVPDLPRDQFTELDVDDVGNIEPPNEDAIVIGVVDSGVIAAHPLLEKAVVGAFGVPAALGDDDRKGHGTSVSGIATYGDIREKVIQQRLNARFWLASAKVVNDEGRFDSVELVPSQMEQAIRRLHGEFGCRVVNVSLADQSHLAGVKRTAWAAVLDDLARELDLVIVVSAGNSDYSLVNDLGDRVVAEYPRFLLEPSNRVFEPATAINALTVGSISEGNGLDEDDLDLVDVRPITDAGQPSPFTRVGTGKGIKPDFVDYGGTAVFVGLTQTVVDGSQRPSAGILTLNSAYLERLLTTRSGTSFASPRIAYKAALLRDAFPDSSANLIRALLAVSAEVPDESGECLEGFSQDEMLSVVGYGLPDVERALASDDNRVILTAEDSLPLDRFAVYEVPIPELFQVTRGKRRIKVALAFDPPVRHTRLDYAGVSMSFRLNRGASLDEVFDAHKKWKKEDGPAPKLAKRYDCKTSPGPKRRERGTLQCGTFNAQRQLAEYGDRYYLVVRCEGGWADAVLEEQRFAVAVELSHQAELELYERMRLRVQV